MIQVLKSALARRRSSFLNRESLRTTSQKGHRRANALAASGKVGSTITMINSELPQKSWARQPGLGPGPLPIARLPESPAKIDGLGEPKTGPVSQRRRSHGHDVSARCVAHRAQRASDSLSFSGPASQRSARERCAASYHGWLGGRNGGWCSPSVSRGRGAASNWEEEPPSQSA